MKKIILVLVILFLVSFGIVNAVQPEDACLNNPNTQGCLGGNLLQTKCTDAGGVYVWEAGECMCTIFFGTPQQMPKQSCVSVPTAEELKLASNNCIGGALLKDGTCCPLGKYPYNDDKKCCDGLLYDNGKQCCEKGKTILSDGSKESCISCDVIAKEDADKLDDKKKNNCLLSSCDDSKKYQLENGFTVCCPGMVVTGNKAQDKLVCIVNTEGNLGINMNSDCLINGQCSYNIYKTLGIRKSDQNPKVSTFVQDIVLGVTMFLGTVISLVLIISGVLYILAGIQGNSSKADMAKKGIINSLLGLVLVTGSYALVRLIQFVATAGGG